MVNRSQDLTQGSISAHLARMTIPMFLGISSMIVASMVDTIYIGIIGAAELAAFSFTFPLIMGLSSVSMGIGTGAASLISRAQGSGDRQGAQRFATHALMLTAILVFALMGLAYFYLEPIWIGGIGEKKTLRLVAKHADGWNAAYTTVEHFAYLGKVLDQWCEKENRDPATLKRSINLTFNMGTTDAEVEQERANLLAAWGPAAQRIEGGALLCKPTEAVDRIKQYADAGADMVNIALRSPWHQDALDAYIEEVMPALR